MRLNVGRDTYSSTLWLKALLSPGNGMIMVNLCHLKSVPMALRWWRISTMDHMACIIVCACFVYNAHRRNSYAVNAMFTHPAFTRLRIINCIQVSGEPMTLSGVPMMPFWQCGDVFSQSFLTDKCHITLPLLATAMYVSCSCNGGIMVNLWRL